MDAKTYLIVGKLLVLSGLLLLAGAVLLAFGLGAWIAPVLIGVMLQTWAWWIVAGDLYRWARGVRVIPSLSPELKARHDRALGTYEAWLQTHPGDWEGARREAFMDGIERERRDKNPPGGS